MLNLRPSLLSLHKGWRGVVGGWAEWGRPMTGSEMDVMVDRVDCDSRAPVQTGRATGIKGNAVNTSAHPQPGPRHKGPVPSSSLAAFLGEGSGSGLMGGSGAGAHAMDIHNNAIGSCGHFYSGRPGPLM